MFLPEKILLLCRKNIKENITPFSTLMKSQQNLIVGICILKKN